MGKNILTSSSVNTQEIILFTYLLWYDGREGQPAAPAIPAAEGVLSVAETALPPPIDALDAVEGSPPSAGAAFRTTDANSTLDSRSKSQCSSKLDHINFLLPKVTQSSRTFHTYVFMIETLVGLWQVPEIKFLSSLVGKGKRSYFFSSH